MANTKLSVWDPRYTYKAGQRIRTWQLTEPWANWILRQPDQRE